MRGLIGVAVGLVVVSTFAVSTLARIRLPEPTGPQDVGRSRISWTDVARREASTADPSDNREVVAELWYPAAPGSAGRAAYIPGLEQIEAGLVASGEVSAFEAAGLRFVAASALAGAPVSPEQTAYPVILLSPGNATNVLFYASLAEELASHGYVVVGVEHPYQVTAVALAGGRVATYRERPGQTESLIDERVADVRFVLDQLAALNSSGGSLDGRLDLDRVGIMGHSNGGITAAEACRSDARLKACLNIDGQLGGGPLSVRSDTGAPPQPFMYLTKETVSHPVIERRFEDAGRDTFRVVVPAARHDQFVDTALFKPSVNPFDRKAASVIKIARGFSRAFFDHVLRGRPVDVFGAVAAETDVYVNIYPLGGKPPLPTR